jgi:hypothetical protein
MASNNPKRKIKLALPKNPSAVYSNTVMITHNQNEFIFDFIQVLPNDTHARVQQRVAMTPTHAKMFLNALQNNIERYENKHGEIDLPQKPQSLAEQLFQGINEPPQGDDDGE